jgi:hypothetical protein
VTQALGFSNPAHAQSLSNATASCVGVDMQAFHRAFFILDIGGSVGSLTATLQESLDNNTGWTTIQGNNTSQASITTASRLVTFEVRADQMTKRYARLSVTENNVGATLLAVIGFGAEANHKPGSAQNGTQVLAQNVVN